MKDAWRKNSNPKTPQYHDTVRQVNGRSVWTGLVRLVERKLAEPAGWQKSRRIFVNSMGDLFHEKVPDAWIDRVFDVMEQTPRHTYQTLTKRSGRMPQYLSRRYGDRLVHGDLFRQGPAHMWFGASIEDQARKFRIDDLRAAPAGMRFLSIEPLLEHVGELDLRGIHWIIVGGESGPRHRPFDPQWARDIRDQCVAAGVKFFFKQHGGPRPKSGGDLPDGRQWHEFPEVRP
jgi:protein gp37